MLKKTIYFIYLATIVLSLLSCTQRDPSGFIPLHTTPSKGITNISQFFSTEISGGFAGPRLIKIFHHDGNKRILIGVGTFPTSASRQNGYAMSDDGKTLLYFHQERYGGNSLKKKDGLYEFKHGRGDALIHDDVNKGVYIREEVPSNSIVYGKVINNPDTSRKERTIFIRTTDGVEAIWPPRKRK